jgi:hypothetical protein
MSDKFNVMGPDARTCPLCFRNRALGGPREGPRPILTCAGCLTQFRLTWSGDDISPDTLTRVTPPAPAAPYVPVAERGR